MREKWQKEPAKGRCSWQKKRPQMGVIVGNTVLAFGVVVLIKPEGIPMGGATGDYLADVVVLGMQGVFSNMEQILYAILVVILTTLVMNKMIPNGKTSMQVLIISKEYRKIQKNTEKNPS